MEKEFLPYELAVKLKELGFDEPCFGGCDKNKKWYYHPDSDIIVDVPLWQQAFDWFREEHNFFMSLQIFNKLDFMFKVYTVYEDLGKALVYSSNYYPTYEEARNACLEKLIELIQNKNDRSI